MRFWTHARLEGEDDAYYKQGNTYMLEVRKKFFSKRIVIWHVHGYECKKYIGSNREYRDLDSFKRDWVMLNRQETW